MCKVDGYTTTEERGIVPPIFMNVGNFGKAPGLFEYHSFA
jgi:hypothetical protein